VDYYILIYKILRLKCLDNPMTAFYNGGEVVVKEERMGESFGTYKTVDGKLYDCYYYHEEEKAEAVGPYVESSETQTCTQKVEIISPNIQHAKQALEEKLGEGKWIWLSPIFDAGTESS
jgi:hypothetical protein